MADQSRGAGISLLVPFRDDHESGRAANWTWLRKYWEHALPEAEIVLGDAPGVPFSKTRAINAASRTARGNVFVLLDADCYISASVILHCAEEIRKGRDRTPREPVWFIPYRHLFRLTQDSTLILLASDPTDPFRFDSPPEDIEVGPTSGSGVGHWFGALIQILPREAFEHVGGMDARFAGWGGEDVSFVRAVDTLFGVRHTSNNQVLTLWHAIRVRTKDSPTLLRMWEGQGDPKTNWRLAGRYHDALRNPTAMRALIDEWVSDPALKEHRIG